MTETAHHSEIEAKFEGPPDGPLDLTRVKGVAAVVELEPKTLRAIYYDTSDLRLAAHGVTLRERSGGDDDGWHLKVPATHGHRVEIRVPRSGSSDVPTVLSGDVRALSRDAELLPVMLVHTERRERQVFDASRRSLAVVASDEVTAERLLGASGRSAAWSEWEVELVEGDEALLERMSRRLRRAGLTSSEWPSKLAHALTAASFEPERPYPAMDEQTAGAVVVAHLRDQVDRLELHDVGVRTGQPDSVHQMRVATRRLRSALATYRPLLAGSRWEDVRAELKWIGQVLGRARDAEVLRDRLDGEISSIRAEQVLGPVKQRIDRTLRTEESDATSATLTALEDDRYLRLVEELESLVADPPLSRRARKGAKDELPKLVRSAGRRVRRAHRSFEDRSGATESDALLHEVRKAAKRARYAAESAELVLGKRGRRMAGRMEAVQELLGEHQDSVAARRVLRQIGVQAHLTGENGFTFGLMWGMEEARAATVRADYEPVIRAALAAADNL